MPFNINEFSSELSKGGIAKTSHFEVYVTGPQDKKPKEKGGLINAIKSKIKTFVKESLLGITDRGMTSRIDSVDIPGRFLTTADYKHKNYGPLIKIPYGQIYSDVNITIILSEDMKEKRYFEEWQNAIQGTGYDYTGSGLEKFNSYYYDDYVGVVEIRQYGSSGTLQSIHKLNGAYPIGVGAVSMAWGTDDVAKLPVTFSYRNYRAEFVGASASGIGFGLSIGPKGLQARITSGLGNFTINKGGTNAAIRTPFGIIKKSF